jgi:hypothetical protein
LPIKRGAKNEEDLSAEKTAEKERARLQKKDVHKKRAQDTFREKGKRQENAVLLRVSWIVIRKGT